MSIDTAIKEYIEAVVERTVEERLRQYQVEEATPKPAPEIIKGITGLAKFLNISTPTAQKLKNSKKIPFRQYGRIVIFKSDEVLEAMKKRK